MNELSQREKLSASVAIPAALVVAWVHWDAVPRTNLMWWLICTCTALFIRLGLSQKRFILNKDTPSIKLWRNMRVLANAYYGISWGALWFLLNTGQLDFYFMFKFASLAAVLGITVNTMGIVLPAYISFVIPVFLMSSSFIISDAPYLHDTQRYALLFGIVVYAALLVSTAANLAKLMRLSIMHRFEREIALAQSKENHQSEIELREHLQKESAITAELKNQLLSTLDAIPDLLFEVGLDGHIYDYHSPHAELLAAPPEIFLGKTFSDVLPPDVAEVCMSAITEAHKNGLSLGKQYELQLPHGKFWFELSVSSKPITQGQNPHFLCLARDITKRKLAEQSLLDSEERLRLALDAASQGWFDLDVQKGEIIVSAEYPKILGYNPIEFNSSLQEWQDNLHPEDRDDVLVAFQQCLSNGGPISMEYRRRKKDGDWVWLNSVGKITEWGPQHQPLRMIGIHTNITDRKLLELELKHQAHIDYLTGISNRGYFMEQAEQELNRAVRYEKPLSICMLDIDFFKQVNDSHGHKVGDTVLKKLTAICQKTVREVDVIGRLGGEEFAILLPETGKEATTDAAERLRVAIANTKVPLEDGLSLSFTISIGVASLSSNDDNIDVLLNLADKALYEAKNSGRNKVCVGMK